MAVPAHDSRDYDFALKHDVLVSWVVMPDDKSVMESGKAFSGEGTVVNSSNTIVGLDINGLSSKDAAVKVIEWAERTGNGKRKVHVSISLNCLFRMGFLLIYSIIYVVFSLQVNYKLRDWLFARQRYWGEPIPVIFLDDTGETVPLNLTELPLVLPELDDFSPTGTGEPPLSKAGSWVCINQQMVFVFIPNLLSRYHESSRLNSNFYELKFQPIDCLGSWIFFLIITYSISFKT